MDHLESKSKHLKLGLQVYDWSSLGQQMHIFPSSLDMQSVSLVPHPSHHKKELCWFPVGESHKMGYFLSFYYELYWEIGQQETETKGTCVSIGSKDPNVHVCLFCRHEVRSSKKAPKDKLSFVREGHFEELVYIQGDET